MLKLLLVAIILGGFLAWHGYREWELSQAAKATPQTITCAKLEKDGPGDNAHVIISDIMLCPSGFVYQSENGDSNKRWSQIWIPAVSTDSDYVRDAARQLVGTDKAPSSLPPPKNIRVLIKSTQVHDDADLERLGAQDTIQGVVINKVDSVGASEKNLLAQQYPGIDFDKCWIVEHDRKPTTAAGSFGFMGGGVALVGVGVFLTLRKLGRV